MCSAAAEVQAEKPMTASPESNNELFVGLITANYDHLRRYIYTLLPHEEIGRAHV